jgi:hypothetical protein
VADWLPLMLLLSWTYAEQVEGALNRVGAYLLDAWARVLELARSVRRTARAAV